MKIAHLIVDYKSEKDTSRFIKSLESNFNNEVDYDIFVLCNSGTDNHDIKNIESYKLNIQFIDTSENIGYLPTVNKFIKDNNISILYDFVVFSNSDMELISPNYFNSYNTFSSNYSVIAPRIETSDNISQNPFLLNRISKVKFMKLLFIFSNKYIYIFYNLLSKIKNKFSKKNVFFDDFELSLFHIYAPHGSFIIFNSNYFKLANLNFESFLYGEELYIAEQCVKNDLKVGYYPSIFLRHYEHQSTSLINLDVKRLYLLNATRKIYEESIKYDKT